MLCFNSRKIFPRNTTRSRQCWPPEETLTGPGDIAPLSRWLGCFRLVSADTELVSTLRHIHAAAEAWCGLRPWLNVEQACHGCLQFLCKTGSSVAPTWFQTAVLHLLRVFVGRHSKDAQLDVGFEVHQDTGPLCLHHVIGQRTPHPRESLHLPAPLSKIGRTTDFNDEQTDLCEEVCLAPERLVERSP